MPVYIKPLWWLFFVLPVFLLSAQFRYSIKNFNANNGLPQNEITALGMGYWGNLWIGTRSGLVRYDGNNFKVFELDQDSKDKVTTNNVHSIINIPADKKTIIKTALGNLYSIENGIPVLLADVPYANDGSLHYTGLFPSLGGYKKYVGQPDFYKRGLGWDFIPKFVFPVNGNAFIMGSIGSDTLFYVEKGVKQRVVVMDKTPAVVLPVNNNFIFLDKEYNMYLYEAATNQSKKISVNLSVAGNTAIRPEKAKFMTDSYSRQAFCFYNTTCFLLKFNSTANAVSFIPQFTIEDKHEWTSIVYDSLSASFFLGTEIEGIFQVKLKKLTTYSILNRYKARKSVPYISYTVLAINDSTVITPSGLRFSDVADSVQIKTLPSIYSLRETMGMLKNGSILCAQNDGIYYYSPADNYLGRHVYNDAVNKRYLTPDIRAAFMLYPEGDSVWLGSYGGSYCITPNKITPLLVEQAGKITPAPGLRYFYRLNNSKAFAAAETGLFTLKTTTPYLLSELPEMRGKQVRHITAYKDVFILSVHNAGLYIYKDARFYKVPIDTNRQQLKSCHSTYIDKKGFIWITTDRGLYKSTPSSIVESALNNTVPHPFFWSYGLADGIDNVEFNGRGMPDYAVLKNGRIFYPSMAGIVTFIPEDVTDKIGDAQLLVEKVVIDGQENNKKTDSIIRLKAGFKFIAFELVAPFFGDPANIVLDYRIDDGGWQQVPLISNAHWVSIVDISAGRHTLVIRKRTGFGDNDYAYTSILIYKSKHIYEQLWFYPAVLVIFIFIVWLFLRLKTQNINRKRKALQKRVDEQTAELSKEVETKGLLISIISHDMVAPQRHVSIVAKTLRLGLEKDPQKINEGLSEIQATSDRILAGSTAIINWMKYNNKKIEISKQEIHVHDIVNETMDIYVPIAKDKNILLVNEVPASTVIYADYNILSTILTNIISNAVKYTNEGTVRIYAEEDSNETIIKVADTGRGMNEKKLNTIREVLKGNLQVLKSINSSSGLGYVMISELQRIHNLTVLAQSETGNGTIVSIIINKDINK